jgi:hypothetical protein
METTKNQISVTCYNSSSKLEEIGGCNGRESFPQKKKSQKTKTNKLNRDSESLSK